MLRCGVVDLFLVLWEGDGTDICASSARSFASGDASRVHFGTPGGASLPAHGRHHLATLLPSSIAARRSTHIQTWCLYAQTFLDALPASKLLVTHSTCAPSSLSQVRMALCCPAAVLRRSPTCAPSCPSAQPPCIASFCPAAVLSTLSVASNTTYSLNTVRPALSRAGHQPALH